MKIYLAGASTPDQIKRVLHWADRLTAAGHEVVSTWPAVVGQHGGNPREASDHLRNGWAHRDLQELRSSDLVWLLVPPSEVSTRGAWFELGYARALQLQLVCSGDTKQSIFCALADEYSLDELAFQAIGEAT